MHHSLKDNLLVLLPMLVVESYDDINDFLRKEKIPLIKWESFYIVKFEDEPLNMEEENHTAYKHNYFEISFTEGYNASVSIGDEQKNTLDYNLSFVSPGQVVTWELNEKFEESESFLILFKPEFLPFARGIFNIYEGFPYFNSYTLSSYQLNSEQKTIFRDCFRKIYEEYKADGNDAKEMIRAYLSILLFTAKRELEYSSGKSYMRTRSQEITYHFENLIKKTQHKHQPLKYYAEQLSISAIYLAECVKKVTGKTAKQIIDEYLILEAKSHLKQSTESISEVAYAMGFEDSSNFVKYFKKQTGKTPKQYKS